MVEQNETSSNQSKTIDSDFNDRGMGIFLKPCKPLKDYTPMAQFKGYFRHPKKYALGDDHQLSYYTGGFHADHLDF